MGPRTSLSVASVTVTVTARGALGREKAPYKRWGLRFVQSPSGASEVFFISRHLPIKNKVHTGISITMSCSEFSSHYKILTSRLFRIIGVFFINSVFSKFKCILGGELDD